jgi:hypothetical protein
VGSCSSNSRVGLWDLAHLVPSVLYSDYMNAGQIITNTLQPCHYIGHHQSHRKAMHKVWCLPTILSSISTIIRYKNNEKKRKGIMAMPRVRERESKVHDSRLVGSIMRL